MTTGGWEPRGLAPLFAREMRLNLIVRKADILMDQHLHSPCCSTFGDNQQGVLVVQIPGRMIFSAGVGIDGIAAEVGCG